jgi:hypothetical protein
MEMNYFNDAKALLDASEKQLAKITAEYNQSLTKQQIGAPLLVEIKNLMENLRSALDYTAHGLFEKYGNCAVDPKIYFPYAWLTLDLAGFRAKNCVGSKIPGLPQNRPDIVTKIESYQHFSNPKNRWLPIFMDLNNENKHQKLTPQTRTQTKQLTIQSGGSHISLGEGSSIQIRGGAFIQIGDSIMTGHQNITPDNPAKISGSAQQTVTTWVSFNFTDNNEPVLPLLTQALVGTTQIVDELSLM